MLNSKTRHKNTHAAMGLELLPPQNYTECLGIRSDRASY